MVVGTNRCPEAAASGIKVFVINLGTTFQVRLNAIHARADRYPGVIDLLVDGFQFSICSDTPTL